MCSGALRTQIALEGQGAALIAGAFDAMSIAAFVVNALGQVTGMTARAEAAVAEGGLIRLTDRRLRTPDAKGQARLDAAILDALAGAGPQATTTLVLRHPEEGGAPMAVSVSAFERPRWSAGNLPARARDPEGERPGSGRQRSARGEPLA
jgi:hypothetical protein